MLVFKRAGGEGCVGRRVRACATGLPEGASAFGLGSGRHSDRVQQHAGPRSVAAGGQQAVNGWQQKCPVKCRSGTGMGTGRADSGADGELWNWGNLSIFKHHGRPEQASSGPGRARCCPTQPLVAADAWKLGAACEAYSRDGPGGGTVHSRLEARGSQCCYAHWMGHDAPAQAEGVHGRRRARGSAS